MRTSWLSIAIVLVVVLGCGGDERGEVCGVLAERCPGPDSRTRCEAQIAKMSAAELERRTRCVAAARECVDAAACLAPGWTDYAPYQTGP